jgi:dTDP-4-amino-4,6-dideoxygalactose transaminase
MEIALRWFGVSEGDEVIIPAYTYCATANVVVHCGATPVMVDVNSDDFNISVEKVKNAITSRTKAIIPVDLGGMPADYDELFAIINSPEIKKLFSPATEEQKMLGRILVLSDSAHSIGAQYKGKKAGSLADISAFSFHAVKNLTTAEGGAIALNLPRPFDNELIYKYLNTFILHGQNKDALAKTQKGAWRYDVIVSGYKGNMTDIMASIGLVELSRYETEILKVRKHIFDRYTELLRNYEWAQIPVYQTNIKSSSYHLYCLRIKNISETQRDEIIQKIFESDVSVNVHYQPLPMLTAFKSRAYKISNYPVSYDNYSREITLPVWYGMTDEMIERVVEVIVHSVVTTLLSSG